jgi:hypothetical protein
MPLARAVVLASAMALATSPAAAGFHPFQATLVGNAHLSDTSDPTVKRNDETATGQSTPLGQFTWVSVEFVDFDLVANGVAVFGSFTITAQNGDKLFGHYITQGFPNEAGDLIINGIFIFTGGTGQLKHAIGFGEISAVASLAPGLPFTGEMDGIIVY